MNLKLAKTIRQGMREMAGIARPGLQADFVGPGPGRQRGGAIKGRYPDEYEGEIPRKGHMHLSRIFHHDYIHSTPGGLWAEEKVDGDGTKSFSPTRIMVKLKLMSPRQVYKRAKRMVA